MLISKIETVLNTVLVAVLALLAGSCITKGADLSEKEDVKAGTHTADAEATVAKLRCGIDNLGEFELPDSSFRSVENLIYRIDSFDLNVDGKLSDMNNSYEKIDGILTFRGQPSRSPHFSGRIDSVPSGIKVEWVFKTAMNTQETQFGVWGGGTGWTGQPLYINWSDSSVYNLVPEAYRSTFTGKEIIVSSLCGKVYFLDYETGLEKRTAIDLRNPVKGTAMLDPSMNGNLYVGHGIPCEQPFGQNVINLYRQKIIQQFGVSKNVWRQWNAFDSSPVVQGQFLFWAGENGTVYKFSRSSEGLKLHSILKYRLKNRNAPGIESSISVYRNYGYISDNHGNILCFNLNNLRPVWRYDNHDDCDATTVIEEEGGKVFLYSGSEIDKSGQKGISHLVKLDALTGVPVWEQEIAGQKTEKDNKTFDGGMFATPLLGGGNCSEMLFSNFVINDPAGRGEFVAFNKHTGKIIYRTPLKWYSWSSPVAIYNRKNEMFVFIADTAGNVYIIEGKTGKVILVQRTGNNFESSPIIIDNKIVMGSRGREIYKLSIE